jgi:hypothetical protein
MQQPTLSQLEDIVPQYGATHGIDTSKWRIVRLAQSCMISRVRTPEQAQAFSQYLAGLGFLTQVVAPIPNADWWSIVAVS